MVFSIDIDKFLTRDDFKLLAEAEWTEKKNVM